MHIVRQLSDMETTAREFARNFRRLRAAAARGKIVRVKAPDGVYLFMREKPAKTCGTVLEGLAAYAGRGFLTDAGAAAIATSKRKPAPAKSPWDAAS
jgi:hypothetical protein